MPWGCTQPLTSRKKGGLSLPIHVLPYHKIVNGPFSESMQVTSYYSLKCACGYYIGNYYETHVAMVVTAKLGKTVRL